MRKRPLLWIACVFLTGLAYERYEVVALLLIPVFLLLQEFNVAARHATWKKAAGRSILLLSAFLFGCMHMHREEVFREAYLSKLEDGNTVTVWGEIKSIDTTEYGNRCILTDCYIRIHKGENMQAFSTYTKDIESAGRIACNDIMVYTSSTHYQVGEIHEITGQFQHFSTARNQGDFDTQVFYQSQKIDFQVEEKSSRRLGASQSWIKSSLLELRDNLKQVYEKGMNTKTAGFYVAMILGDKSNLEESTKALFTIGGISHVLAISGLHVSIIGRRLYQWLRKRRMSFLFAGLLAGMILLMYCYMVGSGMSTIRAVGMMLLFFLAQYWGRSYDMLNALGGMCLYLLVSNPFLMEYSGFWFSVLALLGIGFVGPAFVNVTGDSLWMSVGITLCTLPVVAYSYYEIPLYSTLVNMIALPLLAPVFLLAVIGGILGLWMQGIANFLFIPCEWLLWFYEWLCSFVRALPGASIICGAPSPMVIVAYYSVLLTGVWWLRKQKRWENVEEDVKKRQGQRVEGIQAEHRTNRKHFALKIGLSMVCLLLIIYPKARPFEISFLDVGQGDGIYISTGDGICCFIDGGSTSVNELGKYRILPFLKSKGVDSIDYWFVTHADTDHISGLLEVLEDGYEVKHLVVAEAAPRDENYMALLTVAEQSGTEIIHMKADEQISTSHVRLTCLYPSTGEHIVSQGENTNSEQNKGLVVDRNEASLVLELEVYGGVEDTEQKGDVKDDVIFRALFSGDISSEVEHALIQQGVLSDVDLYKAAHHGSKYSNSSELLEIIRPEIAVVSCSENNLYGHPSAEAIARMEACGVKVLYTMKSGQVTINRRNMHIKFPKF